ncbi:hypothetical protein FA13DRAFT_1727162 [Coprinellus micaceus]|uniref:Uncharacterized protein n=1 Tax=Coprinellus micaceus TaxID=71717 RepID=A0A4Y7TS91_COPMI|nr:hypothetical protein FA13DRAFT_1727162 [Coprinellus micaceus]
MMTAFPQSQNAHSLLCSPSTSVLSRAPRQQDTRHIPSSAHGKHKNACHDETISFSAQDPGKTGGQLAFHDPITVLNLSGGYLRNTPVMCHEASRTSRDLVSGVHEAIDPNNLLQPYTDYPTALKALRPLS